MRYVFYDLETTGLSQHYDQILQFAAIVTDDNFVEIERSNMRCRLSAHVLPSPVALAVTGVFPKDFLDPSLPSSFEMVQAIRQFLLRHAPATWIGYNSLRFDENFLRQAFYQNLQPNVYETQFNGNNRLDVLHLVQACRARAKEILQWPSNDKGKVSLKLDQLAPANGFTDHHAHDALGDVEATLHLTRLIARGAPDLWAQALHNRNKREVIAMVRQFQPLQIIRSYGGSVSQTVVCFCALAGNNAWVMDIENHDPHAFFDLNDAELAGLFAPASGVLKKIAVNQAPNVFPVSDPSTQISERARAIQKNTGFLERIKQLAKQDMAAWEVDETLPVEERIYGGFYSDLDKDLLEQFQQGDWDARANILDQLQDRRLKQLGNRLLIFHGAQASDARQQQRAVEYLQEKWLGADEEQTRWMTFAGVDKQLNELRSNGMLPESRLAELEKFFQTVRAAVEAGELPA